MTIDPCSTSNRKILGEISSNDLRVRQPHQLAEVIAAKREAAIREAWVNQANSDRALREKITGRVLVLTMLQTIATIAVVAAAGAGALTLPADFYKFGLPSMSAVSGLALVITKYLFDRDLRQNLDEMMKSGSQRGGKTPHE